jgi:hypothetical protein
MYGNIWDHCLFYNKSDTLFEHHLIMNKIRHIIAWNNNCWQRTTWRCTLSWCQTLGRCKGACIIQMTLLFPFLVYMDFTWKPSKSSNYKNVHYCLCFVVLGGRFKVWCFYVWENYKCWTFVLLRDYVLLLCKSQQCIFCACNV